MGADIRITAEDLFHRAADLAVRERVVFLDRVCAGKPALRREVEDLLRFDESSHAFLEKPALQDAARNLARNLATATAQADTLNEDDWRLGPYRIRYQLGKGGMGVVYLALDTRDGREVALKVLPPDSTPDEDRLARFTREGRMLAELRHANIAEIYEQAEYDGKPCIALEYVPGDTLADRLQGGPLPIHDALHYALQIADALNVAHDRHIVHRDLKPANIKITPDGAIKVLDFGLAKHFYGEMERDNEPNTRSQSLTESGMLLGTPAYMSPEQWNGQAVDQRTDLWAFGCLLYEMLAGDPPFEGKTRAETMKAVFAATPDWGALPAGTPLVIQDLLRRCFETTPERRLRNAGQARQMIARATVKTGLAPMLFFKSQAWRIRRHARVIAVALLLLLCVTVAGWRWRVISQTPARKYVAVKPFLGFADAQAGIGFADELRRNLLQITGEVYVAPLMELLQMNLLGAAATDLSLKLGTNLTIEGEVHRIGSQMRIEYRVLNSHRYAVSSGEVEGPGNQLDALQRKVAERVAEDLALTKSSGPRGGGDQLVLKHADATEQYLIAIGELQKDLNRDSVEKPIAILLGLIESEGNSARLQSSLARAYLNKYVFSGDAQWAEMALRACEQAIAQAGDQPESLLVTRGLVYAEFGNFREAARDFKAALAKRPQDWEALSGLARSYGMLGESDQAEHLYFKLIQLWPNYWASHDLLGRFYYKLGRHDRAIASWMQVVKLLPESPTGYNNLATAYLLSGQDARSQEAFQVSIAKDNSQDNIAAYSGLGSLYYYRGQYRQALDLYLRAREIAEQAGIRNGMLFGNLADAYRRLAQMETTPGLVDELSRRAQEAYEQAGAIVQREIGEGISDPQLYASLAEWAVKRGQLTEAQTHIQKAAALDDQDAEVAYAAVLVAHSANQREPALRWLEKAACGGYGAWRLMHDPDLEPLRADHRFQSVLTKCQQTER
jgi:tetratricopeptide (TPR) repeat protein